MRCHRDLTRVLLYVIMVKAAVATLQHRGLATEGYKVRFEQTEGRISEFEDKAMEISESEEQKEKRLK